MDICKHAPPFLATRHSCGPCHADSWPFVEHPGQFQLEALVSFKVAV